MPRLLSLLLPLLLLAPARSQPYQTSFANITVDRVEGAFQDPSVYRIDPASGALELAIPIGPGIGAGALRFTPTVVSRQAQQLGYFHVRDMWGGGELWTVTPSFMSILPGYLDLKTGPELDSDATTYVSQYEVGDGVGGSLDGPPTPAEQAVDGTTLLRTFGYAAAAVAEMGPFGLEGSVPFVKYTSTGDLFIALEEEGAPRFTLRCANTHYQTPAKALIIHRDLAYEFTSVYQGAEAGGRYSVRINRFRLTGIRTRSGQRIQITYAGGPNSPDYTAEWLRDGQPTGVRIVFRQEGGVIRIDYPADAAGAAPSFTLETGLSCPDLNNPIYYSLCGIYNTTRFDQSQHRAYITTPMYQSVRRITNNRTGSALSISYADTVWAGHGAFGAHYTLPNALTFPSGRKVQLHWSQYPFRRNDARNGVWKGYYLELANRPYYQEFNKDALTLGVDRVEETDLAGEQRVTTYARTVPRPANGTSRNGWSSLDFRVVIGRPDGSSVVETYWPPLQGSDGGPGSPWLDQVATLAHLKHVLKERAYYPAGATPGMLAARTESYRDLSLRRNGIPSETIDHSVVPVPLWKVTVDNLLGTTESEMLADWAGSPVFAWKSTLREVRGTAPEQPGDRSLQRRPRGPVYELRSERSFDPLPALGLFPRPAGERVHILQDLSGGLAPGQPQEAFLPWTQLTYDAAHPALDRVLESTQRGAATRVVTTFQYQAEAGDGADRIESVSVHSPDYPGEAGIERFGYDSLGRLSTIQKRGAGWSLGQETDVLGRPVARTDANELATRYRWDEEDRLTAILPPAPLLETRIEYASDHRGATITRGEQWRENRYNGFGERVLSRMRVGQELFHKVFKHDPGGRKVFESVWLPGPGAEGEPQEGLAGQRWSYDGLGRPTGHTDPNGVRTQTQYSMLDRLVTSAPGTPAARTFTCRSDIAGRLVEVLDPLGQSTRYGYDPAGRLALVTQGGAGKSVAQERRMQYGDLGWLTALTDPEHGSTTFGQFNVLGQAGLVTVRGDGTGAPRVLRRTYDATQERLTGVTSDDGSVAQRFAYDRADAGGRPAASFGAANGRMTCARDGTVALFRSYGGAGGALSALDTRVGPEGTPLTWSQRFEVDGYGNRVLAATAQSRLAFDQDPTQGIPSGLRRNGVLLASGSVGPAGQLRDLSLANGIRAAFSYDPDQLRLHALDYSAPGARPRHQWTLDYDGLGLPVSNGEDRFPERDLLGRLGKAEVALADAEGRPDPARRISQSFGYDVFGNLIRSLATGDLPGAPIGGSSLNNFTFNAAEQAALARNNHLPATASGVPTGAAYDPQGNLTDIFSQASGGAPRPVHLTYDALARVRSASCAGTVEQYEYSPDGLRTVIREYRGQALLKTRYNLYNDARQLASQYEVPGAAPAQPLWTRDLLYLGARQVGEADGKGVHLALVDPLGTPRTLLDAQGNVESRQKFLPFGETIDRTGSLTAAKGFTDHEQTDASGLIYMQGRFYLPQYHRFVSPDPGGSQHPENPQSWNLYSYALNDPTMLIDPTGLEGVPWYLGGSSPMVDRALGGLYGMAVSGNPGFQMIAQGADVVSAAINAVGNKNLPMLSNLGQAAAGGAGTGQLLLSHSMEVPTSIMAGEVGGTLLGRAVGFFLRPGATTLSNPIPDTLARVIPNGIPATTLGRPGSMDVFVTAASDIQGMNAAQIADRLSIQPSLTGFKVIQFPTPEVGLASPVFRMDPGFVGGGLTAGGAREFVLPNQPIPSGATTWISQ